ncbi:hypothetical protein Sjap_025236 [Stephania japonica]|uniref:Uncharacterized protein n=1 Tax=Stephania japonica TaxID=461633 RepID=A0AAP0HJE9_9MAGN
MEAKNRTLNNAVENSAQQNGLVNWMSMDDTPVFNFEKLRNEDFTSSWEESDDSEEDEDDGCGDVAEIDNNDRKIDDKSQASDTLERNLHEVCIASEGSTQYLERPPWTQNEMTFTNPSQEIDEFQNEDVSHPNARFLGLKEEHKRHKGKEVKNNKGCKMQLETLHFEKKSCKGPAGVSSNKKSLKVPFCPKEIKRVLQSEGLQLKNAQAHTIRKIIVFASLGIRHGCEDLYELDFNHFKILQKGEPYVSTKNPGEHVLYDHPGTRQKIFYPNRQNLTLCPVQILEEEKTMRPPDDSCPSCLFLCIKYGGRTRNLPQNEYVRQRMGRNKLKSFGPLMCRMAKLVHIRSGSFFFKALGITLLFMAGFSGNLVQRETKYRNLDLLQKYYRLDEEAEGEELFHSDSTLIDNVRTSTLFAL